jgi:tetratricopeptide (TPR) repeat protein
MAKQNRRIVPGLLTHGCFSLLVGIAALNGAIGCAPKADEGEYLSLFGRPLLPLDSGKNIVAERNLAEAQAAAAEKPDDLERQIWLGRRYGYLWRMREAIEVFTRAAKEHADDPRPLRHRGHRYISVRLFDKAVVDLSRAAELLARTRDAVEPDGLPNMRNFPLTTTGFNVYYHLALAQYLRGDYGAALTAWRQTAKYERGLDDNRVAVAYWTYLTLRRLGRESEANEELATVLAKMDIIENRAYYRLARYFKGELTREETLRAEDENTPDFAALGYGIGCRDLLDGNRESARSIFARVISTDNWPAFGYIAAEVELTRGAAAPTK